MIVSEMNKRFENRTPLQTFPQTPKRNSEMKSNTSLSKEIPIAPFSFGKMEVKKMENGTSQKTIRKVSTPKKQTGSLVITEALKGKDLRAMSTPLKVPTSTKKTNTPAARGTNMLDATPRRVTTASKLADHPFFAVKMNRSNIKSAQKTAQKTLLATPRLAKGLDFMSKKPLTSILKTPKTPINFSNALTPKQPIRYNVINDDEENEVFFKMSQPDFDDYDDEVTFKKDRADYDEEVTFKNHDEEELEVTFRKPFESLTIKDLEVSQHKTRISTPTKTRYSSAVKNFVVETIYESKEELDTHAIESISFEDVKPTLFSYVASDIPALIAKCALEWESKVDLIGDARSEYFDSLYSLFDEASQIDSVSDHLKTLSCACFFLRVFEKDNRVYHTLLHHSQEVYFSVIFRALNRDGKLQQCEFLLRIGENNTTPSFWPVIQSSKLGTAKQQVKAYLQTPQSKYVKSHGFQKESPGIQWSSEFEESELQNEDRAKDGLSRFLNSMC